MTKEQYNQLMMDFEQKNVEIERKVRIIKN